MAFELVTTPLVAAFFDDAVTRSNVLSRAGYPLSASAVLVAGGAAVALILSLFLSGGACPWCRAFDLFSSELWVVRDYEDVLAAPPEGFERAAGWQAGARAKGFEARRKGTLFGGTAFFAALAAGLALSGDVIAHLIAASRCVLLRHGVRARVPRPSRAFVPPPPPITPQFKSATTRPPRSRCCPRGTLAPSRCRSRCR